MLRRSIALLVLLIIAVAAGAQELYRGHTIDTRRSVHPSVATVWMARNSLAVVVAYGQEADSRSAIDAGKSAVDILLDETFGCLSCISGLPCSNPYIEDGYYIGDDYYLCTP